ncbi:MAG: hypothetical protein HN742_39980 [Lentisphaerae bacterium]|jgi:uroporphyrinogen decarboxylase|nr:hypothetical protein [Lentisphaerota bacterium]MBT4821508.1 hypothetical protein [Lentisphaerota bacterium]MBT5611318.1 hypothetical protein [Lentisphaerota bacterium]MBT7058156.1 hypothetical protein [Lentisphaerota bacterium]MBT7848116.1 hypothetical protein [Lentisphaerota bacterium]
MTGRERVEAAFDGQTVSRPPTLPILHSGLCPIFDTLFGRFLSNAETMADVVMAGATRFGYDGVQLSLGVTAEPEALGARTSQPEDAATILEEHLLADDLDVSPLSAQAPARNGRFPMFAEALSQVMEGIGETHYVLTTLRGPLLMASQLCGVEPLLIGLIDAPKQVTDVLDFTTEVALEIARALAPIGAPGVLLGEATCSPNFISPTFYRDFVLPRHTHLVGELKAMGWRHVGLHICGGIQPIIEDIVNTGVDFFDVDHQVTVEEGNALTQGRAVMRGNLDPSSDFRFGSPADMAAKTRSLLTKTSGSPWILSSGCDIPPGTPPETIDAFVQTVCE